MLAAKTAKESSAKRTGKLLKDACLVVGGGRLLPAATEVPLNLLPGGFRDARPCNVATQTSAYVAAILRLPKHTPKCKLLRQYVPEFNKLREDACESNAKFGLTEIVQRLRSRFT